MGFSRRRVQEALRSVGAKTLERALGWLLAAPSDAAAAHPAAHPTPSPLEHPRPPSDARDEGRRAKVARVGAGQRSRTPTPPAVATQLSRKNTELVTPPASPDGARPTRTRGSPSCRLLMPAIHTSQPVARRRRRGERASGRGWAAHRVARVPPPPPALMPAASPPPRPRRRRDDATSHAPADGKSRRCRAHRRPAGRGARGSEGCAWRERQGRVPRTSACGPLPRPRPPPLARARLRDTRCPSTACSPICRNHRVAPRDGGGRRARGRWERRTRPHAPSALRAPHNLHLYGRRPRHHALPGPPGAGPLSPPTPRRLRPTPRPNAHAGLRGCFGSACASSGTLPTLRRRPHRTSAPPTALTPRRATPLLRPHNPPSHVFCALPPTTI